MRLNLTKFWILAVLTLLFISELMLAEKFSYASSIAENGRDMNEYLYTHKGWIEELIFRLSILSVIGLGFYSLAKNIRKTNKIIFYVFILLQCWMLMHALISYSVGPKFIISELHGAKGPLVWLSLSLIFISLDPNNWNYIKKILLVLTNIAAVIVLYKVVFEFPGFIFKKQSQMFFVHYLPLLLWTAPFFIYDLNNKASVKSNKIFIIFPFVILIMSVLLSSGRSWMLVVAMHMIFFLIKFKKNITQKGTVFFYLISTLAVGLPIAVYYAGNLVQMSLTFIFENAMVDTRSDQYIQFFSQMSLSDLITGLGPRATWIWDGEIYQYIDGAITQLLFNGGLPLVVCYFILIINPGIKILNKKTVLKDENAPAIILLFWMLALLGLATFT